MSRKIYAASLILALLLCFAQISGSSLLILPCLAAYLVLVAWGCVKDFTLPLLLFFLPWSPLMRTSTDSFSFFTFSLVMVSAISVIKNSRMFRWYHILAGLGLMFFTLLAKLVNGYTLSFDYIAFLMLIFLFPVIKEETTAKKYDFYVNVVFLATGIIVAALCAQQFSTYSNISRYIKVDSYLTITRMCGFYGDANFYTAQITAALAGGLVLILREKKTSRTVFLAILLLLLLYCGLLSGSKSFAIIAIAIVCVWIVEVLKLRGRLGLKISLLAGCAAAIALLTTSAILTSLVDVIATRFSFATDVSGFTTGRTDLWKMYLEEFGESFKLLCLGSGFTNVMINGRASHNTILQAFYQLGLVGVPFLVAWVVGFFRNGLSSAKGKLPVFYTIMLLLGVVLPWFALDMLFFDDFFLMQWYLLMGLCQLRNEERMETQYE